MASFTFRSAASSGIYAKLVVTEHSQSIANNTTTLLWELYMWNTQAKPTWYAYEEHNIFRIQINNQYVLNTEDFGMVSLQYEQTESTAKLITSGTITITHNSDGTKTGVPVSFYGAQGWYNAYVWEASGTMNLTTIARASVPTLSASSVKLGGSVTIYTNRASDAFTHTLKYSIGSASGTLATDVGASYTWNPIDKELARQFPNTPSGIVTITCETYNGSTLIGSKPSQLTVTVSDDMVPTISSIMYYEADPDSIPSNITGFIQSKSKLRIVVSAAGSYGSTITSYKIVANGSTYNTSDVTTGYLTTAGSNVITVEVKDSRGKPKTGTTNVTVVEYKPPRLDSWKAYRCDAQGNANEQGEYIKVDIAGTITSLSSQNTREILLQTRKPGDNWGDQSITISDGYTFTGSSIIEADIESSYEVRVFVGDSFTGLNTSPYTMTVSTASVLINIREEKDGMAIGKMAEKAKTVQLGWDLELKGDPTQDNHAASKKYVDEFKYGNRHVITVDGDANTYYPVLVGSLYSCQGSFAWSHLHISRHYSVTAPNSWYTSTHKGGLSLSLRWSGDTGWGGNDQKVVVEEFSEQYSSMVGGLALSVNGLIVWLRGGTAEYTFQTDYGSDMPITVYLSTFTASDGKTYAAKSTPDTSGVYDRWYDRHGSYNGTASYAAALNDYAGSNKIYIGYASSGLTPSELLHLAGYTVDSNGVVKIKDVGKANVRSWLGISDITDYPVAQGTSGIWRYIKFNSGIAMCWATSGNVSSAFSSTWGSLYVHDNLFPQQTYPFSFTDYPRVFASPFGLNGNVYTTGDYWIYSGTLGSPSISPAFSAARPTKPSATITICASILAIGMWR